MSTELTTEQRDELARHGNKPVEVVDPVTKSVYFLVAGEMFDHSPCWVDSSAENTTDNPAGSPSGEASKHSVCASEESNSSQTNVGKDDVNDRRLSG